MLASGSARNRLKSVAPFVRCFEVTRVILPFIAISPPGRNNPPILSAHNIDHHDFYIFQHTESQHSIFAMTSLRFLEYRALKNPNSIGEVDKMLREIRPPLCFVPLEKHPLGLRETNRHAICTKCTY